MKTNKYFQYATGFFVAVTFLILAACGDKSNNNTPAPVQPIYGYNQCVNCQGINGPIFFTAESTDYTNMIRLSWSFAGQNSAVAITPGTYIGAVSANGQMFISQSMNLGYCVVPAGNYTLSTLQIGQWGYGIVSGLALQAFNGAVNLTLSFNGQVSSPGYLQYGQQSSSTNPVGRMFGNLRVESINGQICQQIIGLQ